MPATVMPARQSAPAQPQPARAATQAAERASSLPPPAAQKSAAPARPSRLATDDEILGLDSSARPNTPDRQLVLDFDQAGAEGDARETAEATATTPVAWDTNAEPENLRAIFEANPDLRRAWHEAQSYRETFATPEEARAATALLADLDRMDALFFSRRPEDHAELARAIANLDPAAFASLAQAMNGMAANAAGTVGARHPSASLGMSAVPGGHPRHDSAHAPHASAPAAISNAGVSPSHSPVEQDLQQDAGATQAGLTPAQAEFFHATNAAAVQGVLDAIESQVERLLPDGVSKSARNRVVGEIYRELDTSLRSNRQLAQQMREAFRSGGLDADHQRAIVSLVTGRARQALPSVAKRVLNEWTSTIVAANQDRLAKQRAAERRVDIAGSSGAGNDGRRPMTPHDIDYARLSDADILNL
jgi:hypothetical protein